MRLVRRSTGFFAHFLSRSGSVAHRRTVASLITSGGQFVLTGGKRKLSFWLTIFAVDKDQIVVLRRSLRLSQAEFGQLFDAHAMTVSKWERGVLVPSAYQHALLG
jgi:hypothetical protein